ncbi:cobalamin biosynthesis protein [Actinacidiphila oryziradicis]|uniref:cobalamin biosynthesis protein n=1 Tax=Actinacidiphila oryziradicis TaxID=2571141 RepID=UPI001FEBA9EB|nr:cobalamin biosynthesis protein [Actinacidiphila oryziradicis]
MLSWGYRGSLPGRTQYSAARAQRAFAYGAALGYLADLAAADPRRGHPVAAFGRAAAALEHRLWRDHRGRGAAYTALCAGGTVAAAALAARAVRHSPAASAGLTATVTWAVLGGTSLGREARAVGTALEAGDIEEARARLPHLCGRDPQALDGQQIARAVVESVAENTSDAVVGALVWGALGGVPGLAGFRAVNTLDAMVGHKSPRHRRFGWASARLDDVVGWPGARLTAVLAVLAGPDPRGAWRVWRQDGARHPSPNAGPVEASFAGALGVRLGGTLAYAGRAEHRPVLGAGNRPVEVRDIERAVRLSRRVGLLALAAAVGGRLVWAAVGAAKGAGAGGSSCLTRPFPKPGAGPRAPGLCPPSPSYLPQPSAGRRPQEVPPSRIARPCGTTAHNHRRGA